DPQVAERHLVAEDGDAVHPFRPRDGDAQAADADPNRQRPPDVRVVDEEDGSRADEAPVGTLDAPLTWAERDDARSVGGDGGVVLRHPESTGEVALPVRQLPQEDVA